MFRKLHLKLTFLYSAITIGILFLFAALYLYITENSLNENHKLTFQRNIDAMYTSLEQQNTLTLQYLKKLEVNGGYSIFIWDRQVPFDFNRQHSTRYQKIADTVYQEYRETIQASDENIKEASNHMEFVYRDTDGAQYDISIAEVIVETTSPNYLKEETKGLELLVIYSRSQFEQQLKTQRIWFLVLAAAGCISLTLFAWFLTGKLLLPIRENHRRQTQFIADASHELRTPLAVIRSCITVRQPRYEDIILQECIHMGHLVEDMLTLNGLENKTRMLHKEELEADTILLNSYEQMEALANEKKLRLEIKLPDNSLPRFHADPVQLQQVLVILIQNAISYTPSGGKIELQILTSKKYLAFQIQDTGPGISDPDKKKIFERFYRSDSSHNEKEHFGLGLCIAKEIMAAHNGQLKVTDTPGGGATFTCSFPLTP